MPTYKQVSCHNCNKIFKISLKRFNEYKKRNWFFYCSKTCLSKNRKSGKILTCANNECSNFFYRRNDCIGTNNYCSGRCAAIVNNQKRKHLKNKQLNYCLNPNCKKEIPRRNKFCSNKCQMEVQGPDNEYYLEKIRSFYMKYRRLPVKREMDTIYQTIRKRFGTWNNAIEAAGFIPNPVLFAKKHIAEDGHKCDSLAERIIDDWLHERNLPHEINVPYPINQKLTADFVIGKYWIEFFGLAGQVKKYDQLVEQKINIAKRKKLTLIKIYPNHLFPKLQLEKVLKPLLEDYLLEY